VVDRLNAELLESFLRDAFGGAPVSLFRDLSPATIRIEFPLRTAYRFGPLKSSRLNFLARMLISLVLIGFVLHKLDWREVGMLLRRTDPRWALAGTSITFALVVLLAVRWRIFLRRQNIPVSYWTVFALTWSGQFFNFILPGSTGGDFVKIFQLCRMAPDRKAAAAVTVIIDRFTALVALVTLAGAALLACPVSWRDVAGDSRMNGRILLIGGAAFGLVAAGAVAFMARHSETWLPRVRRVLAAFKTSLAPSPALGVAILLSFCIHFVTFTMAFCFARSLGLAITYPKLLQFFPVLLLLVMMPVTVNGHGLREVLLIFYFGKLGIGLAGPATVRVQDAAVAFSALLVANDLLWSLPGGLCYFLRFANNKQTPAVAAASRSRSGI